MSARRPGAGGEALASWAKVSPGNPFFDRAALRRGTQLINTGHYTLAEATLEEALAEPAGPGRYDLERALSRLYRFEGRQDDVRRVGRASWVRSPDPPGVLKELYLLDHSPLPAESLQRALDKADGDDDRVWLGRANHALATGRLADAAGWLERCLQRRPEDAPVWKARLNLAMANNDEPGFWEAVAHLPARLFDEAAVHTLRAWAAASSGDCSLEYRELTALLKQSPGDTRALERLAILCVQAGMANHAKPLRGSKTEIDRAHEKLRLIVLDTVPMVTRAEEVAKLMFAAGRDFDARAWSIVSESRRREPARSAGSSKSDGRSPLASGLIAAAQAFSERHVTQPTRESRANNGSLIGSPTSASLWRTVAWSRRQRRSLRTNLTLGKPGRNSSTMQRQSVSDSFLTTAKPYVACSPRRIRAAWG